MTFLPLRRRGLLWPLLAGLGPAFAQSLNFTNTTALGYDPVQLMCARWEHQSVLKGNTLYIDGGLETYYNNITNFTGQERYNSSTFLDLNYYLLGIDMSSTWNWEQNISITLHNKSASSPNPPPTTLRGHLFQGAPSDPRIYLYGGADFTSNTSVHASRSPTAGALWSWDPTNATSAWHRTDISGASPWQPSRGARAEAPGLGLGFWLNGEAGGVASVQAWGNLSTQVAHLEGMVVLDTANRTGRAAWNVSTAAMTGGLPRTGAGMVYVPEMGAAGALVLVGGIARAPLVTDDPASGELVDLNSIQIWDVASWLDDTGGNGTWYQQTATGDVPELRTDFCVAAGTAPDNSSHNVYLYGGRNPKSGTVYDDVYALSLPSFTWIKLFTGQSPRWGHTCHLAPNSTQLLTLGGALATTPTQCDWEYRGVAVLDSHTMDWNSVFDAAAAPYKVTQGIAEAIGGGDDGAATKTLPASGSFDTPALAALFARSSAVSSPSPSSSSSHSNTGAIVGGVVGGTAGLALASLAFFLVLRRRRPRRGKLPPEMDGQAERVEAADTARRKEGEGGEVEEADAELPGNEVAAQELDGEDQFERIVELDGGERFELAGSGVGRKEGEVWEEARGRAEGEGGGGERGDV